MDYLQQMDLAEAVVVAVAEQRMDPVVAVVEQHLKEHQMDCLQQMDLVAVAVVEKHLMEHQMDPVEVVAVVVKQMDLAVAEHLEELQMDLLVDVVSVQMDHQMLV